MTPELTSPEIIPEKNTDTIENLSTNLDSVMAKRVLVELIDNPRIHLSIN